MCNSLKFTFIFGYFCRYLFSPYFTSDEENDVKIQRRIRQLSWITAKHLACSIDEVNPESRELVYNAITGNLKALFLIEILKLISVFQNLWVLIRFTHLKKNLSVPYAAVATFLNCLNIPLVGQQALMSFFQLLYLWCLKQILFACIAT